MRNYTLYVKFIIAQVICGLCAVQSTQGQNTILYGMTENGGTDSLGAIIAYNVTTNTETVVWNFGSGNDGQQPTGNLVYCPLNGLLYALATSGGMYDEGAIVSFNPANDSEEVVWNLGHSSNGPASPYGDLVWDASNQLFYGMTFGGGSNGVGGVFQFNPAIDSVKQLWNFNFGTAAGLPYGNLVLNPNSGLYYGMTSEGGNYDGGAIITLNTATDTVHRVFNFNDGPDGETPNGSLVWLPSNNLFYGVTSEGGNDSLGVLFSFNPADSVETVLHEFGSGNDAAGPLHDLIYDNSRSLFYGLSITGGTNSTGTVFSFDPATNNEAVLYNFGSSNNDGQFPNGSLIYDPGSQLYYGMTQNGGTNMLGTVFSFNPDNNAVNILWSLGAGFDGSEPQGSFLLLNGGHPTAINQVTANYKVNLFPNPTYGNFTLQSQNATGATYNIYNTIGDNIAQGTIQSDMQGIHLNNTAPGMYILMINGSQGEVPIRFAIAK